jgi:two-component system, sensor histidine kinase and response regulator
MMRDEGAVDAGFDREILGELRELAVGEEPSFLSDLLDSYVKESRGRLLQLREAARRGDRRSLLSLAHALKGSSANLGASHLAKLSSGLEMDLRRVLAADGADADGGEARWADAVEQIAAEFERVSRKLGVLLGVDR